MMFVTVALVAALLVVSGCSATVEDHPNRDDAVRLQPGPKSRAPEAARQACLAYNEAARKVRAGTITDARLEADMHTVAALAAVAEDPLFEAAADALWHATRKRDRKAVEHAARVFAHECERLVPGQRLVEP